MTGTREPLSTLSTTPHDCCLVVALPLTRARFLRDIELPGSYARLFQEHRNSFLPETVWDLFEPWANTATKSISAAQRLGVHVVGSASLEDFVNILLRFKAITLFAHWRSAVFLPEDLVDQEKIFCQLRASDSRFRFWVEQLRSLSSAPQPIPDSKTDGAELLDFLNRLLAPEQAKSDKKRGDTTAKEACLHERRTQMEAALPGAFTGGAGAFFDDGWYSVDAIVERSPPEFAGALDLTVCNSTLLAEKVRHKCPKAIPIANEEMASATFRFILYPYIIKSLQRQPEPYEDAVLRVRRELVLRKTVAFKQLLAKYGPEGPVLGTRREETVWSSREFRADLKAVGNRSNVYFLVCVGMVVVLFGAGFVWTIIHSHQSNQTRAAFGAGGVALVSAFYKMMRLWKDKLYTDLLLVLAANLNPEQTKQVLEIILRKLKP
ncbi:MAG: hypothetical protein WA655_22845 [Candidatus Korobacteraceae bacterium]